MGRTWSRSIALSALVSTTIACADAPTGPVASGNELLAKTDANFTVDRAVYTAVWDGSTDYRRYSFQVVARFTNPTDQPVYLSRCYSDTPIPTFGVELIGEARDHWGSAYNGAWACVGHDDQFEVLPGATRIDTIKISGPNAWDGVTGRAFGVLDGKMRLIYGVQGCRGDGACRLTTTIGQSAPFEVKTDQ